MQTFWLISMVVLLVLGCSEKGAQTGTNPESPGVKSQEMVQRMTKNKTVEAGTPGSVESSEVDPVLKDYVYPGSDLGGQWPMDQPVSFQFTSADDFAKVVDYYKRKFPDTHVGSGTTVYFGKENPDGSHMTVTLTKVDNGTQVILKLDKQL